MVNENILLREMWKSDNGKSLLMDNGTRCLRYKNSPDTHGVFMIERGGCVTYFGTTPSGWWYWIFQVPEDKLDDNEYILNTIGAEDYTNEGCSVGFFDSKEEAFKDLFVSALEKSMQQPRTDGEEGFA